TLPTSDPAWRSRCHFGSRQQKCRDLMRQKLHTVEVLCNGGRRTWTYDIARSFLILVAQKRDRDSHREGDEKTHRGVKRKSFQICSRRLTLGQFVPLEGCLSRFDLS